MSEHRIHTTLESLYPGARTVVGGEEAQHAARVKRCEVNESVGLIDGHGRTGRARIARIHKDARSKEWEIELLIEHLEVHQRPSPRVEVWSAVPKGGRLDDMIEQLSQVGAAAWAPLEAARSIAEPTGHKLERLQRIVIESAKQCGRAWPLEVGAGGTIADAAHGAGAIMADASGVPIDAIPFLGPDSIRVMIGPEGGWTDDERRIARSAGVHVVSFGPHVMRIETAAVAAAAIVLARFQSPPGERTAR